MSISSTSRKAGPFACNGVTTTFSFSFKVFEASDLLVVLTDSSDAETELVLNTGYTVSLNADQNVSPGGTITTTATHATGYKVTITTEVPATQEVTIPNGGAFYPAVLNEALDRLTVLVQQVQEQVSRCIKTAISSDASPDAMLASISQAVSDAETAAAAAQAAADAFGGAGVLAITYGGTGATTASAARTALGLGDAATKTIGTGAGQVPTADQVPGLAPSSASLLGAFRNLAASATGTNANVSVTADEIVVEDSSNAYKTLRNVSLTIAGTTTGANALDTGTIAASTWYALYVIAKADGTTAGLLSLSATAPTLPSGYTFKARVGWIRTDGTANKYPLGFTQYGRRVQYKVASGGNVPNMPIMANGATGSTTTPTWTAVGASAFVPPTAAKIALSVQAGSSASQPVGVCPNSSYGSRTSLTNPPFFMHYPSNAGNVSAFEMIIESSNIYWACEYASVLCCNGWEDNI